MKSITQYESHDRKIFKSSEECQQYEKLLVDIQAEMINLPGHGLKGCEFENGGGYIQHEPTSFNQARTALLSLMRTHVGNSWNLWIDEIISGARHSSHISRIISDGGSPATSALYNAWHRFSCTDSQLREWGQPYYESHPEEAKQVRLNP